MRNMLRAFLCALAASFALVTLARAEPINTGHVRGELVSARAAIAPGERFTVVLRQSIAPGWHTYWRNPGDSGEATTLDWTLPHGFSAGPLQWPAPQSMRFGQLVVYVHAGEVLMPIELTAPAAVRAGGVVALSAKVAWLVCTDQVCIPEQGALRVDVPVRAQGRDDPAGAALAARARAALPSPLAGAARISAGDPARLSLEFAGAAAIRDPEFFAYDRDAADHAPAAASYGPRGLTFSIKPGVDGPPGRAQLDGVMAFTDARGARRALEVHATPGAALSGTSGTPYAASPASGTAPGAAPAPGAAILPAMLLAFLGGLILNLMPCVLPVLSLKALQIAKSAPKNLHGGAHAGRARRDGILYLAGVVATFLVLALALVSLRAAGQAAGWGFQLQAPLVGAGLALLFFAIGLNLVGVFEIGGTENLGAGLAARGGDLGAFFTGALAVVAATPCTAPFMAGAIGAALTQSAGATLAVFLALALGFAAPLAVLSFTPGLRRLLPKPGDWMQRFRQVLAFPMFASAAWLAWVVTEQAGASAALALLSLATALAFALVVARWGRLWMIVGTLVFAATLGAAIRPLSGESAPQALAAEPWSAARVAELRAEGRPVFVDFTADWCVTCKVNEALALSSPRVAAAFASAHVAYLKADWTRRDPAIAAELAAHGRAGVPLYLYYRPQAAEPVVLDQILTAAAVTDVVAGK